VKAEPISDAIVLRRDPETVLAEAVKAAQTLMRVMNSKPDKVIFNGERYLEADDWMTIGHFYGVTAKNVADPEFVNLGGIVGFKATCALMTRDGREVGRATAFCLTDEEKWSSRPKYARQVLLRTGEWVTEDPAVKIEWSAMELENNPNKPGKQRPITRRQQIGVDAVPLFQLASMAQTRANAKVHSSVLRFVPVLAGFKATPAEELPEAERVSQSARPVSQGGSGEAIAPQAEGQATPENGAGITRPFRMITDADRAVLVKDAFLITEVAPGFAPMVAQLTVHTGDKFPISAQPVKAMAENCCENLTPVLIQFEDLPTGGMKVKKLKRAVPIVGADSSAF
jgi:hypothetical protein